MSKRTLSDSVADNVNREKADAPSSKKRRTTDDDSPWVSESESADPKSEEKEETTSKESRDASKEGTDFGSSGFASFGGLGFAADKAKGGANAEDKVASSPQKNTSSGSEGKQNGADDKSFASQGSFENVDFSFGAKDKATESGKDEKKDSTSSWNWSWDTTDTSKSKDKAKGSSDKSWNWEDVTFKFQFDTPKEWGSAQPKDTIKPIAVLEGEAAPSGDADDTTHFSTVVKVYQFDESWAERGEGELKVNYIRDKETGTVTGRLLCRRDRIHNVLVNAPILTDVDYKVQNERSIQFVAKEAAPEKGDSETAEKLVTYAIKPRHVIQVADLAKAIKHVQDLIRDSEQATEPVATAASSSSSSSST